MFDDVDDLQDYRTRTRWQIAGALGAVALLVVGCAGFAVKEPAGAWMRGERDLLGNRTYEPEHPVALDQVDLEAVHAELLPNWEIAASRGDASGAGHALAELKSALAADQNLVELVDTLDSLSVDAVGNADRILWVAWAWNQYVDPAGWRISATIQTTQDGGYFYTKSYKTVWDGRTRVGEGSYRSRIVARVDHTNVVELYLGSVSSHEDGAIVVVDRVHEMVLRRVWPLLDPALDALQPDDLRAFAPAVRAEVDAALDPGHVELLRSTASSRKLFLEAIDAIHSRHSCGSTFVINVEPYDGLADRDLLTLRRVAAGSRKSCPDVTANEAMALRMTSEVLRDTEGLKDAVEALVALGAHAVLVHEARHAADDDRLGGIEELPCNGCPPFGPRGRAEASAYLASFAHAETSVLSQLQACGLDRGASGFNGVALEFLLPQLGDCSAPMDRAQVKALAAQLFDNVASIEIVEPPTALELSR